jgi:hypothetical protein
VGGVQVPHSFSSDGTVKYGDTIQLRITHKDAADRPVDSYLANNIWNRVDFAKNTIAVSATPLAEPVARNTFVVSRPYARSGKATGAVFGRSARSVVARAAAASSNTQPSPCCNKQFLTGTVPAALVTLLNQKRQHIKTACEIAAHLSQEAWCVPSKVFGGAALCLLHAYAV